MAAPITSFELKLAEGAHSVLAANGDLCGQNLAMPTAITGQNGAVLTQSTKVAVTGCGITKPKPKKASRAQKLSKALAACKKKPKRQRAKCERQARKKYGAKKKKAKKH